MAARASQIRLISAIQLTQNQRVEIDSDEENVVVTWWETNQIDEIPVMRVSDDNGETFGPILRLATNGTIGEEEPGEEEE